MLSATVTVTLDHATTDDLDHADRRALQHIERIPDGARLVVNVGRRHLLMPSSICWLSHHSRRLHVEVSASTPDAARRWYDAIKNGGIE